MTSVVTDVLNSVGVLAKEDIPSKVESLRRKIEEIKLEVQESLKSRYGDFIPQYVKLDKLVSSLHSAKDEYDRLCCHVEKEIRPQMSNSVSEYHELFDDLKRIKSLKHVVCCLVEMHKSLENAKSAVDQKSYPAATEDLLNFEVMAKEVGMDDRKDVEIFCALRTEFYVARESIIYQLSEEWKRRVSVRVGETSKKYLSQAELVIDLQNQNKFQDVIQSLASLRQLDSTLKTFSKQFLGLICEPLVCKSTEMKISSLSEMMCITVSVTGSEPASPLTVCSQLTELFQHLNSSLFGWTVEKLKTQDSEESKETLMAKLGRAMGDGLCTLLVEKCLKPSIPSQSQELENFQTCISSAANFQDFLVELGFLKSEGNPILYFIQNVDELPANKMAVELLSHARELMKQDLHRTVLVGTQEPAHTSLEPSVASPTEELHKMAKTKSGLNKSTFAFPACQISVSAKNLVNLLHQVMKEAKMLESKSPVYSIKLFYTARSICELYCFVVPTHHKEEIANIPQQTAIYHNNCMFIAHCLLTLGQAHQRLNLPFPVTFVDLVPELRQIGTEAFLAQMRSQRQTLLQLLQDSEAFQNTSQQEEQLICKAEKIVRQCLCQLEFLKRVWAGVLPMEVYFKAIGTLLNTFLEEIIRLVCSMEDIAAQVAAQLDSIFGIVLKQSPELFKIEQGDKRDVVHKYVRKWFKFQELQLVLAASLVEIVDRWASGKGPLASHFTADEVKHLIRALFQNTERRAAALGKIR